MIKYCKTLIRAAYGIFDGRYFHCFKANMLAILDKTMYMYTLAY